MCWDWVRFAHLGREPGRDWVRFVKWGTACRARTGKLGSFREKGGAAKMAGGQIGFVSRKYGVAGHLVCWNWVRFT